MSKGVNLIVLDLDVSHWKNLYTNTDRFLAIECDLLHPKIEKHILEGTDALVHLAANKIELQDFWSNSKRMFEVNCIGTINLLRLMPDNLKYILYPSTMSVYGKPEYLPVDEEHSTNPETFYGVSKLVAEKLLQQYCSQRKIGLCILRITGLYGQETTLKHVIPQFIHNALGGRPLEIFCQPTLIRDYLHLDDAVKAICLALEREVKDIYNIGSGQKVEIQSIAKKIVEFTRSTSSIQKLDIIENNDFYYDIRKAEKNLDLKPEISLEKGLMMEIARVRGDKS